MTDGMIPLRFNPADYQPQGNSPYFRMPVGFGPFPGPRQIPHPGKRDPSQSRRTVASVTYRSDSEAIRKLLPTCFDPDPAATVTVEVQQLENLDWLAGRGYSTLGVKFPATCATDAGVIQGDFLAILWENLADPIISGREELGFAKLWCEIDQTVSSTSQKKYCGHWMGHHFFEMELTDLSEATQTPAAPKPLFHYKYFPKTGHPGVTDAAYAIMTPVQNPSLVVDRRLSAKGSFRFTKSSWEELPTLFHIVNALEQLPIKEFLSATLVSSHGAKDFSDQTILHTTSPVSL
jgi:hypothetical protein